MAIGHGKARNPTLFPAKCGASAGAHPKSILMISQLLIISGESDPKLPVTTMRLNTPSEQSEDARRVQGTMQEFKDIKLLLQSQGVFLNRSKA